MAKIRSEWREQEAGTIAGVHSTCHQRNVHDGHLTVVITDEPEDGLHLSISHRSNSRKPRPGRYPTWDEISDARNQFLPADVWFVMHFPTPDEYVNLHETTFHLYERPKGINQ